MEKPDSIVDFNVEMTVSDIARLLKGVVESAFARVKIRGEISGVKKSSAGHIYFTLKDEEAVIDAVSWRGQNNAFANFIKDGLEVVVTGKITTYPMRSNYQIVVDSLIPAGEGALLKLLEERKKKLAAEGLFDTARKKRIPFLPKTIGVVTSPTGAVIRDIINRITDRFPLHIIVWPVAVQGQGAAEEIAAAIKGFNAVKTTSNMPRPDVLIVARGGGSIEDLWPFNEEVVARAAAESEIPLISAVGHETDTTLIDYVSDLRAPTPTGAAEMATPVRQELLRQVAQCGLRLPDAINGILVMAKDNVKRLSASLPDLSGLVDMYAQRLDDKEERLNSAINNFMRHLKDKFNHLSQVLELCSYQRALERGFALVFDKNQHLVDKALNAKKENTLQVLFSDGDLWVHTTNEKTEKIKKAEPKIKKAKDTDDKQGVLLL